MAVCGLREIMFLPNLQVLAGGRMWSTRGCAVVKCNHQEVTENRWGYTSSARGADIVEVNTTEDQYFF